MSREAQVRFCERPGVRFPRATLLVMAFEDGRDAKMMRAALQRRLSDELVRAVMPELRVLLQHLVNTAVERSIAPLLDKQRELEAALKDLRSAQLRPAQPEPELRVAHAVQPLSCQPVASAPAAVVARPVAPARTEVIAVGAYEANVLEDIPLGLDGSRRKRAMMWGFAVVVAALLLSVIALSWASHFGTHF